MYEEESDDSARFRQEEFPSLGVITEDGEFYEEKENDCVWLGPIIENFKDDLGLETENRLKIIYWTQF